MNKEDILYWLKDASESELDLLWQKAHEETVEYAGNEVHLRGLIEISNHCKRGCTYCGINRSMKKLKRYRMSADEIMSCAYNALELGYGTVVMQAGEDAGVKKEFIEDIIKRIKDETGLAVTLSLGMRPEDELTAWKNAGADRYLLRFETSDRQLFDTIHPEPGKDLPSRLELLRSMKSMGYETGSGVMIGIPGQSWSSVADDILMFRELDLDMIGLGPYLPHPETELGHMDAEMHKADEIKSDELTVCRVLALARIVCPWANIPATTALEVQSGTAGRSHGLMRGANVIMPNLTPAEYRVLYDIYPHKGDCMDPVLFDKYIKELIASLDKKPGQGKGGRNRVI